MNLNVTEHRQDRHDKIPLAIPSIPPNALAPIDIVNSHNMKAQSISLRSSSGPAREPGHETDLVTTVIEFLVVDGRVTGGI